MKKDAGMRLFSLRHVMITVAVLMLFTALVTGIAYLMYPDARDGHIRSLNVGAQQVSLLITAQKEMLHVPSGETVILAGEYANSYMLVYGSQWTDHEAVFLQGSQADGTPFYWTVKMANGTVTETWFSKHIIAESELHAYTYEYQRDHTYFNASPFKWYRADGWMIRMLWDIGV